MAVVKFGEEPCAFYGNEHRDLPLSLHCEAVAKPTYQESLSGTGVPDIIGWAP